MAEFSHDKKKGQSTYIECLTFGSFNVAFNLELTNDHRS